jgi:membrane protein implicated in regulation of membrane protease activity
MRKTATLLSAVWALAWAGFFAFISQLVLESWLLRVVLSLAVGVVAWVLMRGAYRRGEKADRDHRK